MLRKTLFVVFAAMPMLAACTTEFLYKRPEVMPPPAFVEADDWKIGEPCEDLPRGKWWEIFNDPLLNALQEKVEISNQTLDIAEAQFRQAQALVQGAQAGIYPSLSGGLSSVNNATGTNQTLTLGTSWEVDLWGRIRQQVASREAGAQAAAADRESARLSVHAALAQDYFLLRIADAQKRLLDDTVAAYEKFLQLTRNRHAAGVASKGDVIQAQTQLKTTQSQAIDISIQRAQFEHAIALLIGKAPAAFSITQARIREPLPVIPYGVPSELLERRPDIAAAERRVAAANAQVGAAKSAFFPTFVLAASGGFQIEGPANWFTLPNRIWSLGPALTQSLFDGGLKQAQSEQAIAAYDAAVATYRQTVLTGFMEVEDNLAALRILEQEAQTQNEALQAARQSAIFTTNQYMAGTVSYLNVIMAQTAVLSGERNAVEILGKRLAASVLLIKALGGGWRAVPLQAAQTPG